VPILFLLSGELISFDMNCPGVRRGTKASQEDAFFVFP